MFTNFRLLPVVMVMATGLLGLKLVEVGEGVGTMLGMGGAAVAMPMAVNAMDTAGIAAIEPAAGANDGGASGAGEGTVTEMTGEQEPAAEAVQPAFMSRSEIDLLQDLSDRRHQLEERSQRLDTRERLLMATEKRIDKKIERLKGLEASIQELLRVHSEEEEAQLESLVRVYEAMKPKDAARIFNKLDLDILIDVVARMKERKIAPVLAAMDAETAKALTMEMATRKELPELDGQG